MNVLETPFAYGPRRATFAAAEYPGDGHWDQGYAISQLRCADSAAQIDRHHNPEQLSLSHGCDAVPIAANRPCHEGENHIVDAGLALVTDGLDFRQRDLSAGKFLRSTVENVKPNSLRESCDLRQEIRKLVVGKVLPFAAARSVIISNQSARTELV